MSRVYPNTLASIQFDVDEETGERVWEVGSYAYRPEGFLGMWQYQVRLTPAGSERRPVPGKRVAQQKPRPLWLRPFYSDATIGRVRVLSAGIF